MRDENSRTETIENSDDPIIWGAEAIGREVGLDERAAFYALERGFLPANKVGKKWATTRRRLRQIVAA